MGEICIVTGNILLNDIESFRLALRVTKLDGSVSSYSSGNVQRWSI